MKKIKQENCEENNNDAKKIQIEVVNENICLDKDVTMIDLGVDPNVRAPVKFGVKVYGIYGGTTCHQCRQKTLDRKTNCNSCGLSCGVFCGICLNNIYGEDIYSVLKDKNWKCPTCSFGNCLCSICRGERGLIPISNLTAYARSKKFRCVKDLLESNDQGAIDLMVENNRKRKIIQAKRNMKRMEEKLEKEEMKRMEKMKKKEEKEEKKRMEKKKKMEEKEEKKRMGKKKKMGKKDSVKFVVIIDPNTENVETDEETDEEEGDEEIDDE